jgi:hypothetical protein
MKEANLYLTIVVSTYTFQARKKQNDTVIVEVKRISVQYAHVSVSRLLQQQKIRYIRKTHGKGVVRICSRTVA